MTLIWIINEERCNFGIITGRGANLLMFNITLNLCLLNVYYKDGLEVGGTKKRKVVKNFRVCNTTVENAIEAGYILHDRDLRQLALKAYKELGDNNMIFEATQKWLHNFKEAHCIVSRKVSKFLTRKTIEDEEVLKTQAA